MHLDRVALDLGVEGIEPFFELRLGQELARPLEEGFEQRPFARRQRDGAAILADAAGGKIDIERAQGDDRVRVARIAPRHRSDARRKLGEVEGLHQIVVGAGVQPLDPVRHLVERGQDDDRA